MLRPILRLAFCRTIEISGQEVVAVAAAPQAVGGIFVMVVPPAAAMVVVIESVVAATRFDDRGDERVDEAE